MHFTDFNKSLDSACHGELFAVCWTRLLGDCVLWQTPSFLHHQFLAHSTQMNSYKNKRHATINYAGSFNNTKLGGTN